MVRKNNGQENEIGQNKINPNKYNGMHLHIPL
jgi:hypothetical protein